MAEITRENLNNIMSFLGKVNSGGQIKFMSDSASKSISGDASVSGIMNKKEFTDFLASLDAENFGEIFDYKTWMADNNLNLENAAEAKNALANANHDLTQIRRIVTSVVRIERFGGGLLEELYKNGFFDLLYEKLNSMKNKI